ncbi:hypothetical protein [Archaeoglobus sp.]
MVNQSVKRYIADLVGSLLVLGEGLTEYIQKLNHTSAVVSAVLKDKKVKDLREKLYDVMEYIYNPKTIPLAWIEASKIHEELLLVVFENDLIDFQELLNLQQKLEEKWKKRGGVIGES